MRNSAVLRGPVLLQDYWSSYLLNGWGKEFWRSARGWTGWELSVINLNVHFFLRVREFFVLHRMVGRTRRGVLTPGYFEPRFLQWLVEILQKLREDFGLGRYCRGRSHRWAPGMWLLQIEMCFKDNVSVEFWRIRKEKELCNCLALIPCSNNIWIYWHK